jgi:hypothetical protein
MTTVTHPETTRSGDHQPLTIKTRSPVRAAILSLVTFSLYGFWWWRDLNRQLKALGQPAHPWRALGAVTVGWIALVPPFRSVHHTTTMVAAVERRTGIADPVSPLVAVSPCGYRGGRGNGLGGAVVGGFHRRHLHRPGLAATGHGVRWLPAARA